MTNSTKEQRDRAAALGEHDGSELLCGIKSRVQSFDTEEEKLLWWAAFMAYMGGMCAAELGAEALVAVQQMTEKVTERVIRNNTN